MNTQRGLLLVALCVALYLALLGCGQFCLWADRMMGKHPRTTTTVAYTTVVVILFIIGAKS